MATCAKLLKTAEVGPRAFAIHQTALLTALAVGSSQPALRATALRTLRDVVAGLGSGAASRHGECLKIVVRAAAVRCGVAWWFFGSLGGWW